MSKEKICPICGTVDNAHHSAYCIDHYTDNQRNGIEKICENCGNSGRIKCYRCTCYSEYYPKEYDKQVEDIMDLVEPEECVKHHTDERIKAYDKIYLQWYPQHHEGDDCTWTSDIIDENDTEYIRSDLYLHQQSKTDELKSLVTDIENVLVCADIADNREIIETAYSIIANWKQK